MWIVVWLVHNESHEYVVVKFVVVVAFVNVVVFIVVHWLLDLFTCSQWRSLRCTVVVKFELVHEFEEDVTEDLVFKTKSFGFFTSKLLENLKKTVLFH